MRIFVTGHSCRHGGGISIARNLFAAFGRIAPEHDYFFTIPPELGYEECCQIAPRHETLVYRVPSMVKRWCWESWSLPAIVREFEPDVIFNTANRGFASPPCPQATLVMDPHLLYPPSQFGNISKLDRFKFWYHRRSFRKSLAATPLVFCQTPVTRERLHSVYGDGFRTSLCPSRFSTYIKSPSESVVEPEPLRHLSGKFRLFVLTRYYPHKNLEVILRLFQEHHEKLRDIVFVLTISPDQHPNAAAMLRKIKRGGFDRNIITVGSLEQNELAGYYKHTDAIFLPTLLESFSGTYQESMQFGRPILTSDMDFARCVCGDAAVYFDPQNTSDICRSILELRDDSALRQHLLEAGASQLNRQSSTWDEIGRSVIDQLSLIVDGNGVPMASEMPA